jgi:hypothetical protein
MVNQRIELAERARRALRREQGKRDEGSRADTREAD